MGLTYIYMYVYIYMQLYIYINIYNTTHLFYHVSDIKHGEIILHLMWTITILQQLFTNHTEFLVDMGIFDT